MDEFDALMAELRGEQEAERDGQLRSRYGNATQEWEAGRAAREAERQRAADEIERATRGANARPGRMFSLFGVDQGTRDTEATDVASGIVQGGAVGIIRAAPMALGGIIDFAEDIGEGAGNFAYSTFFREGAERRAAAGEGPNAVEQGLISAARAVRGVTGQRARNAVSVAMGMDAQGGQSWADVLSGRETVGQIGNDQANNMVAQTGALIIGFASGRAAFTRNTSRTGLLGGTAAPAAVATRAFVEGRPLVSGMLLGAGADFSLIDPEAERFSNLLQQWGVRNEFVDWLAHDDEEGAFEGRFKNAIEGIGVGAVFDQAMNVARWVRARARGDVPAQEAAEAALREGQDDPFVAPATPRQATPEEALGDNLNRAWATYRSTVEQNAARARTLRLDEVAEPGQSGRASADGSGAAPRPDNADAGSPGAGSATPKPKQKPKPNKGETPEQFEARLSTEQLFEDANNALRAAKVEGETVGPGVEIDGMGRIVVSQEAKQKLDLAGFGSAFTDDVNAARGATPIIIEQAGTRRVVGALSAEDIAHFKAVYEQRSLLSRGAQDINAEQAFRTYSRTGQQTLRPIGDSANVPALSRALMETIPKEARVVVPDEVAMREAFRAADSLGIDPNRYLQGLREIAGQTGDLHIASLTATSLFRRLEADLDQFIDLNIQTASPSDLANLGQAIHNALAGARYWADIGSSLGRALRTRQLPDPDSYIANLRMNVNDGFQPRGDSPVPRTREELEKFMTLWRLSEGDALARRQVLEGSVVAPNGLAYAGGALLNSFTAAILSGWRTIYNNVASPVTVSLLRSLEKSSGAAIRAFSAQGLSTSERAAVLAGARDAWIAHYQTLGDVSMAFRLAVQSYEQGARNLGGGVGYDTLGQFGPWTRERVEAAGGTYGAGHALGNLLNWWPSKFAKWNAGLDDFTTRLAYLGEHRAIAYAEAAQQGLTGAAKSRYVFDRLRSSMEANGPQAGAAVGDSMNAEIAARNSAVLRSAQRSTMTATKGADPGMGAAVVRSMNSIRENVPMFRLLMPILNAPANELGETLRRIPGINHFFAVHRDELKGLHGPVAQAEAHGRTALAAGWIAAGASLAGAGMLTGPGPRDPAANREWRQRGFQPYSFRSWNAATNSWEWVSYQRLDVLGMFLGGAATLYDNHTYQENQDADMFEQTLMVATGMANYFKDRAALRGVAEFLSQVDSPMSDPMGYLQRLAGNTGGAIAGGIAFPSFVTRVPRDLLDPQGRLKAEAWDYFLDYIPGASATLDPTLNVFGEPVYRPREVIGFMPTPIGATATASDPLLEDPALDEIQRSFEATGYTAGQVDDRIVGYAGFDSRELRLEDGQRMWTAFMRTRGSIEIDGMTLHEAVTELVMSPEYAEAADGPASRGELANELPSRQYMLAQIFSTYNREARAEVARTSDRANRWLAASLIKQNGDAQIRQTPTRDIAEVAGLAESLGVDWEAYMAEARGD